MSTEPPAIMRRARVVEWLTDEAVLGLSEKQIEKLFANKTIVGFSLPGGTYNYYSREQIRRDIITPQQPKQSEEGPASPGALKEH